MLAALGWGLLASSPLFFGAVLGVTRPWPPVVVGVIMGVGIGAIISALSFDLAGEGLRTGGLGILASGLAAGAIGFYLLDTWVDRLAEHHASAGVGSGLTLAVGAVLDSIPENAVLGLGLARGEGISFALLVAVLLQNLPESMGSAVELRDKGQSRRFVVVLWAGVALVAALATPAGRALGEAVSSDAKGFVNGFAAGALLVMLVDSMAPVARQRAGRVAGLATTLGFAIGVALSAA